MVKDRYEQFQDLYKKNHGEEIYEQEFIMEFEDALEKKLTANLNVFFEKCRNIQDRLKIATELITELEKKQSEILTATDNNNVLNEERDKLLSTIKEITTYIHKDIKTLEDEAEFETFAEKGIKDKMKREQVNVLLLIFQDVMMEYNTLQMIHRDRCKLRIQRQLEISGTSKTTDEIEEMLEQGNVNVFQTQTLIDTEVARDALRDVEARHLEIVKLEKSITDLHEIFQDVAVMVDIQGGMIDSIERNVNKTAAHVAATKTQMKQAYKYKRRKLLTLCCPCISLYKSCSIL